MDIGHKSLGSAPINVVQIADGLSAWGVAELALIAESKVSVVRMAAGGSVYDTHRHDEAILVVTGAITLEVQSETIHLGPGDFTTIKAGQSHRVIGSEGGTLIIFEYSPRSVSDRGNG
jgi:mannose-6-phosphate isomerase-like protein (cupin superfamily)